MHFTCMIVDDEPMARKIIESYLAKLPHWKVLATSNNGQDALEKISEQNVDAIFLDINMPKMSGMELATFLNGKEKPLIVFTTAYPEHAVDGFTLAAVDYLVKPIAFDRFCASVARLENQIKSQLSKKAKSASLDDVLIIRADRRDYRVLSSEILFLEAYGDYVKVHCRDKMLLTKNTLSHFIQKLNDQIFVRVHRSFIVNKNAIEYMEGNQCKIGKVMVPISEKYRGDV